MAIEHATGHVEACQGRAGGLPGETIVRHRPRRILPACALASAIGLAGCGGRPATPTAEGEWDAYGNELHITCGSRPVLLRGSHMDLTVDGPCLGVAVTGDHNDISVTLAEGGTIEITGAHNDVSWSLLPGARGAPTLLNHGASNTFHAGG